MSKSPVSMVVLLAAAVVLTARTPARADNVLVTDVRLRGGLPPPPPVPPQYDKLKNLHLSIPLVKDGKKELVVGISEGLVLALTRKCQKLWSTRLPSPPVSLRCVQPPGADRAWIVAGCEDGTVAALDNKGALIRLGKVTGRPAHLATIRTPAGPVAVLATDRGEVKGFKVGD